MAFHENSSPKATSERSCLSKQRSLTFRVEKASLPWAQTCLPTEKGGEGEGRPPPTWAPVPRTPPAGRANLVCTTAPENRCLLESRIQWVVQAPCLPGRRTIPFHSLIPFQDGELLSAKHVCCTDLRKRLPRPNSLFPASAQACQAPSVVLLQQ